MSRKTLSLFKLEQLLDLQRTSGICSINPNWTNFTRYVSILNKADMECIVNETTGKFCSGPNYIAFENEKDAIIFRLRRAETF